MSNREIIMLIIFAKAFMLIFVIMKTLFTNISVEGRGRREKRRAKRK